MGAEIRFARITSGMTQQELAEKVGCTQQHIQRIESGKGEPSLALLKKLGEVFGVDWRNLA